MTSDDLRFSSKKPKFMHLEQLQVSNNSRVNPFLRESHQIRKSDGRRSFRLGTDLALEEVTKTLEQVVPLRKLLANIQKKVNFLSTQIKEKNREPEEPKKVMSLPGLGIYIVPNPPTAVQPQQSGGTHKRTASYSTYQPIVVHARPSDTNQKEGSESMRKTPIDGRGTQPSPPNELASYSTYYPIVIHSQPSAMTQKEGSESMRKSTIVDRRSQLSPSNESNNDAQCGDAGNDNFIIAEERNKSPPNVSNNSPEILAVATQTALSAQDSPPDSEAPSRHGQTDGLPNNCFENRAVATQTIFPPTTVTTSHRSRPEESRLTKNDVDALPISSDFPDPYLPPYLQYSQHEATNNYPHSGNAVNTGLFQNHVQAIPPVSWNPPLVNISGENSLAVQHPQDWSVLNKNVGFPLNNQFTQSQEVYPTQNRYISMRGMPYLPGNEDRPNFFHEQQVFPLQEQVFPSILDRERPINVVQPQNRHTLNTEISFSPRNNMGPLPQTRELLANCLPHVNGVVYPPYSGNDIGNCLPQTQAAKLFSEQFIVPNHFPPLNSYAPVQQPQDWYTPNQSINLNNPNHIQNALSQPQNIAPDPEEDVPLSNPRNEVDTQQKQIVSVQNNATGDNPTSYQMSRGRRPQNIAPDPEEDVPLSNSRNEVDTQQKQIVSVQNNATGDNSTSYQISRGRIVSQSNFMKESDVHSPLVDGMVCAQRFGDSMEEDPFQLKVMPGVKEKTCPRTPESQTESQQRQIVQAQNSPTTINSTGAQKMTREGIVSQINYTKESGVHSPRVGGLVCSPRFGDSIEGDPFHLEVLPGAVQVTTCPRTSETSSSKEEVSPMSKMYLKLAEPWSRQRPVKQNQAIGELPSLLSDPADTL